MAQQVSTSRPPSLVSQISGPAAAPPQEPVDGPWQRPASLVDQADASELDAILGAPAQSGGPPQDFANDQDAAQWLDAVVNLGERQPVEQTFLRGLEQGWFGAAGTLARSARLPYEAGKAALEWLGLDKEDLATVDAALRAISPGSFVVGDYLDQRGKALQEQAALLGQTFEKETVAGMVGQGFGSAGVSIGAAGLGGALAPLAGVSALAGGMAGGAVSGAGMGGERMLEEAERLGSSPGQKLAAVGVASSIGALEGLGPERLIGPLGKIFGRGSREVQRKLALEIAKRAGQSATRQVAGAATRSAVEEGLEEFGSNVGSELTMEFILEDPERNGRDLMDWATTLKDSALEDGFVGSVVGMVLGGLIKAGTLTQAVQEAEKKAAEQPKPAPTEAAQAEPDDERTNAPEWAGLRAAMEKQNETPLRFVKPSTDAQRQAMQIAEDLGVEVGFVEAAPQLSSQPSSEVSSELSPEAAAPVEPTREPGEDATPVEEVRDPSKDVVVAEMPTETTMFGEVERETRGAVRGGIETPRVVQPNLLDIQSGDIKGQTSILDDAPLALGAGISTPENNKSWSVPVQAGAKIGPGDAYGRNSAAGIVVSVKRRMVRDEVRGGGHWVLHANIRAPRTQEEVQRVNAFMDASEKAVAAKAKPQKTIRDRMDERKALAMEGSLGFRNWVRAMGGLNAAKSGDVGAEVRENYSERESGEGAKWGLGPLVHGDRSDKGMSLDGLLEAAMEAGLVPQGSGIQEVLDLLESDVTPQSAQYEAERDLAAEAELFDRELERERKARGLPPGTTAQEIADIDAFLNDERPPFAAAPSGPLKYPAAYMGGRVAIAASSATPQRLLFHEGLHHIAANNPEGFARLLSAMTDLKPEKIAAARRAYAEAFGAGAPEGAALDEEAAAVFSEDLAGVLEVAFTDTAKLTRVLQDRNVFEVVRDWIARLARTLGGSMRTTMERRLAAAQAADDAEVQLALLWKDAVDMIVAEQRSRDAVEAVEGDARFAADRAFTKGQAVVDRNIREKVEGAGLNFVVIDDRTGEAETVQNLTLMAYDEEAGLVEAGPPRFVSRPWDVAVIVNLPGQERTATDQLAVFRGREDGRMYASRGLVDAIGSERALGLVEDLTPYLREVQDPGADVRFALDPQRVEAARLQAQAEGESTEIGSRPSRIADTSEDPEARAFRRGVREERAAGEEVLTLAEQRRRADAILQSPDAEASLTAKLEVGEALQAHEQLAFDTIRQRATMAALRSGDMASIRKGIDREVLYENMRRDTARALGVIRDALNAVTPQRLVSEFAFKMSPDLALRIERATKRLEEAQTKGNADRVRIETATIERLKNIEAERVQKAIAALKAQGIDPALITSAMLDDPAVAARVARTIYTAKSPRFDWYKEFLISSMLSAPGTQVVNATGNVLNAAVEQHATRLAKAMVNTVVRDPNSPGWAETAAFYKAWNVAAMKAGQVLLRSLRTDMPVYEIELRNQGVVEPATQGQKLDVGRAAIPGLTGRIIRAPSLTVIRAVDEAARAFSFVTEGTALAFRAAKAEGLTGDALAKRTTEILEGPARPDVHGAALEMADRMTFRDPDGAATQAVLDLRKRLDTLVGAERHGFFPLGTHILPFVSFAAKSLRTAVGLPIHPAVTLARLGARVAGKGPYVGDKTKVVDDLARSLVSTAIMFGLYALVGKEDDDGLPYITGSARPGERDVFPPPMSVRVGDNWYSYERLDPASTSIALLVDGIREGQDEDSVAAGFAKGAQSLGMVVADKSYLQTLGAIVDAISEPDAEAWQNRGARFLARTLITPLVPNLVRATATATDPLQRTPAARKSAEDDGVWDVVAAEVDYRVLPTGARAPAAKFDLWGRPLERPGRNFFERLLSPVKTTGEAEDATDFDVLIWRYNQRFERGEVDDPEARRFVTRQPDYHYTGRDGVKRYWTTEQYEELQQRAGQEAFERLQRLRFNFEAPTWDDMERLRGAISEARSRAKRSLLRESQDEQLTSR